MSDRTKKIVLVDGHALAYRAFHALPANLATSRGELTNAVYGFTSMLLNVWEQERPDAIIIAFDAGKSFRHEQFPAYKAQRARMPDELRQQIDRIRQVVQTLGLPIVELEGYEADDLLGTLARRAEAKGIDTLIVTGDTDTFQLISPHVRVLTSRRRFSDTVIYDEERIRERYGIAPQQLIDFKALTGDSSDNIPGVPGIGEKTASALLQAYPSIEEIYAHLNEIDNKRAQNALKGQQEIALRNKDLVTIRTDAPIDLDPAQVPHPSPNLQEVVRLFQELEFRSLLERLSNLFGELPSQPSVSVEAHTQPTDYRVVDSPEALETLLTALKQAQAIAFDTETTSTRPMEAKLVGLSIATEPGRAWYIPAPAAPDTTSAFNDLPLFQQSHTVSADVALPGAIEALRPYLEDPKLPKYAHNAGFDCIVLAQATGIHVRGLAFDTMIAAWICNPTSRNLKLKDLAKDRLGISMTTIEELIGKGRNQTTMDRVPIEQIAPYACADADMTYRLVDPLTAELKEKEGWKLFQEIELPLISVLIAMEMAGIRLDTQYLRQMGKEIEQRLAEIEQEVHNLVGHPFNLNSTQQLSHVLFEELKLPRKGIRKTSTGRYSTSAHDLEKLRGKHPVVDLILEHRTLAKLKSTYIDALPALVNPRTGRVHTSYRQTGTVTGRLSSSDPNLQNIPIRTEIGRQIRRAFVADPGWVLLAADYSQIELRVLAHMSQDPALIESFRRGEDIHASTAAAIFGIPIDQVTKEQRRVAKAVNFGLIYGQTPYGLAQQIHVTPEEARQFIDAYFARFPRVRAYLDELRQQANEQGHVETLLGRRRYFHELTSQKHLRPSLRAAIERQAVNAPIQGSAADILKIAMIRLYDALQEQHLAARMVLQVHDELVLEVPEEELDIVHRLVVEKMEHAYPMAVPLKVDVEVGPNWLDMEPRQLPGTAN